MFKEVKNKIFIYFFNLIFYIFFFNNSIVLCNSSTLPNSNGDNNGLILICILISIFIAGCLLIPKNTTNNNSSINLDNIDLNKVNTKEIFPKLTLDLKNEMLVLKDPIDPVLPNPILVVIGCSIAIGVCVYYIHNLLQDYNLLNKKKRKD